MYAKLLLCGATLLALYVIQVQADGGETAPIIISSASGKRGRNRDLMMIGGSNKCGRGPTLIKTSGRKRRTGDMILLGGENHCHKKKTEVVPMPYPVKEHVPVPVPYKETIHVPIHVPVHIPVPIKEEYGSMDMGGYGGGDMGGYGGGDMGGYSGGYRRRR